MILKFLFYHEKLLRSVDCRYIYRALKIWIRLNLHTEKLQKNDLIRRKRKKYCFFLEYVHLSVFRQDDKRDVTFSVEIFFLRCNYENNNKGKPITSWLF